MFVTTYDAKFQSIPFYKTHPYMMPFVGCNYESPEHKKLLLVGESHYMPKGAVVHHEDSLWYEGSLKLSKDEIRYCDTRGARYCKSGQFGKNIDKAIREVFPVAGENAFVEMASYNYFLRPADYRRSFKSICTDRDCDDAVRVFFAILEILKPDVIVFTSRFAFNHAEWIDFPKNFNCGLWVYAEKHHMNYVFTEHPSCSWWNRVAKVKTGSSDDYFHGLTSRQFFVESLRKNWLNVK